MPLSRKIQLRAGIEAVPSDPSLVLDGTNVVDALEAAWSQSVAQIDRNPVGGSLTRTASPVGRTTGEVTCALDVKGSGTALTSPDFSPLLRACYLREVAVQQLDLSAPLTRTIEPGDILTGALGAQAVLVKHANIGDSSLVVRAEDPALWNLEVGSSITSTNFGAVVATASAATVMSVDVGIAYREVSSRVTLVETTAGWAPGLPKEGEGVLIKDPASNLVGEAVWVSSWQGVVTPPNTLILLIYWLRGSFPAGALLSSKTNVGGDVTATGMTPSNVVTVIGETIKIEYDRDGYQRGLNGAYGNVTATANAGEPGRFDFTFTGQLEDASMGVPVVAIGAPTTTPPKWGGGYASFGGVLLPTKSFTFDAGNSIVQRADANAPNGEAGGMITDRLPTLTVDVEQTTTAAVDLFQNLKTGTVMTVGIQIGNVPGNTLSFCAPYAQLTEMSDSDQDGIATFSLTFACRGTLAGNDEFLIAHF